MKNNRTRPSYLHFAAFVSIAMLTACASPSGLTKNDSVGVAVQSLNYSPREVAYIAVEKPGEPDGGGGGDALNPYSGGGTICCFSIPEKWHPNLKVVIKYNFYPETEYRKQLVSVPPYGAGKAGDIWLIVHADESVEAVVSDYGPTRDEWPGKIKGYPVPSREYRIKIWERQVVQAKSDVALYEQLLSDFSKKRMTEKWNFDSDFEKTRGENSLKNFTGPDDPKYIEHIKNEYEKGLNFSLKRLDYVLKNKP